MVKSRPPSSAVTSISHTYACPNCAKLKQQLDYAISLLEDARLYCDTVTTGENIDDFITDIGQGNWKPPRPMTPKEIDQFIVRATAQCREGKAR